MAGYFTFFLLIFLVNYSNVSNANKLNISFFLITLFVGLRYGIGFDYFSYYQIIQDNNLETEPIPRMLIDVAHNTHFSVFFFITSLWTAGFFLAGLKKMNCYPESTLFYICFPPLLCASFGLVRQAMAYSVIFYLMCHPDFKMKKKILFIVLAFLCHYSSVIAVILLLPLKRMGRKMLWTLFIVGLLGGEFAVKRLALLDIGNPLFVVFKKYVNENMGGGSFLRFLIYALAIVTLVNYEKLCRKQLHIFAVYTCIGASLYASFSVNPHMAERFCTFFFSAILILIPHLRKCMRMPKPIFVFMLLFIFGFYIYTAHMSSSKEGQWAKYKKSLYYPYQTIFEQSDI